LLYGIREQTEEADMKSDFLVALTQLAAERNLPRETVLSAIEAALVSAYRKDSIMGGQDISVKLDPGTGDVSVYIVKTVAEEIEDPQIQMTLDEARGFKSAAQIGDVIPVEELPHSAGRIAAQTAKQVVMQRLREAERELVFEEYADKEGEVFQVTVQRIEPSQMIVELGRVEATLPFAEQSANEWVRIGQKFKVLLKTVGRSFKGPELIVSRADQDLLKRLFEMEVPEIYNGAVEIMAIAREAGARSKVAVFARQDGVDPVGSCVGLRGIRIQNIVNELHGERIDVVEWHRDPRAYIANALSPSQVLRVDINEESRSAIAVVPDRQLSLAIGKEGQNARLAAKLTGWKVDISSHLEATTQPVVTLAPEPVATVVEEQPVEVEVAAEPVLAEATVADETAAEDSAVVEVQAVDIEVQTVDIAEDAEEVVVETAATVDEEEQSEEPSDDELLAQLEAIEAAEESAVDDVQEVGVPEELLPTDEELGILVEEELEEPLPVLGAPRISDLSEDVWSLRRSGSESELGQIRFAEDIAGLRGGITASRGRRRGPANDQDRNRRRKRRGGTRRRTRR
jgi:N utilization substance protein A